MQFKLMVQALDAQDISRGWRVEIIDPQTGVTAVSPSTGKPFTPASRELQCVGGELGRGFAFPLPPVDEASKAAPADPHHDLVNARDTRALERIYQNVIARRPRVEQGQATDIERLGKYLFATLIGDQWLGQMIDPAGPRTPFELALTFSPSDVTMNRLPWEMMCSRDFFLAAHPLISIMRYVSGVEHRLEHVESPPRVLFVVGTNMSDDAIRPGAEYLGLLRSLRFNRMSLKHHLLLEATPASLAAAVKDFRPTVVHFICHGKPTAQGNGVLLMMSDERLGETKEMSADAVFELLSYQLPATQTEPARTVWPQIVVLNACYTASGGGAAASEANDLNLQEAGQVATPFAVHLVQRGIPVVVGMGGRIADWACRLFTRCLYLSMLDSGDLVYSTATGRRAGIIGSGPEVRTTVDWALPVLFISEGVTEPRLVIERQVPPVNWLELAILHEKPDYPAFCGRIDVFQVFDRLLSDAPELRDFRIVAVAIKEADSDPEKPYEARFGRTRLLREMAAKAARDEHVPILINSDLFKGLTKKWPPTSLPDFILTAKRAAKLASSWLGVPAPVWEFVEALGKMQKGDPLPDNIHDDIRESYADDPGEPTLVGIAFRLDLLRFLAGVRERLPEADRVRCKLLLLIDDVHRMNMGAGFVLDGLLGKLGLQAPDAADIRVVFTYSEKPASGQKDAVKAIDDWFGMNNCRRVYLDRFEQPVDNRLAYEYFLFNWREKGSDKVMRLVPQQAKEKEGAVEAFFIALSASAEDVPSYLESEGVYRLVKRFLQDKKTEPLRLADDETQLQGFGVRVR